MMKHKPNWSKKGGGEHARMCLIKRSTYRKWQMHGMSLLHIWALETLEVFTVSFLWKSHIWQTCISFARQEKQFSALWQRKCVAFSEVGEISQYIKKHFILCLKRITSICTGWVHRAAIHFILSVSWSSRTFKFICCVLNSGYSVHFTGSSTWYRDLFQHLTFWIFTPHFQFKKFSVLLSLGSKSHTDGKMKKCV